MNLRKVIQTNKLAITIQDINKVSFPNPETKRQNIELVFKDEGSAQQHLNNAQELHQVLTEKSTIEGIVLEGKNIVIHGANWDAFLTLLPEGIFKSNSPEAEMLAYAHERHGEMWRWNKKEKIAAACKTAIAFHLYKDISWLTGNESFGEHKIKINFAKTKTDSGTSETKSAEDKEVTFFLPQDEADALYNKKDRLNRKFSLALTEFHHKCEQHALVKRKNHLIKLALKQKDQELQIEAKRRDLFKTTGKYVFEGFQIKEINDTNGTGSLVFSLIIDYKLGKDGVLEKAGGIINLDKWGIITIRPSSVLKVSFNTDVINDLLKTHEAYADDCLIAGNAGFQRLCSKATKADSPSVSQISGSSAVHQGYSIYTVSPKLDNTAEVESPRLT